jgi:hypothetical protein
MAYFLGWFARVFLCTWLQVVPEVWKGARELRTHYNLGWIPPNDFHWTTATYSVPKIVLTEW